MSESSKTSGVKLLVIDGDNHAGSTIAPMPPNFEFGAENGAWQLNAVQQKLWGWWRECLDDWLPSILRDDPWDLVHMGDAIEGYHHRTTQVFSTLPSDHVAAFMALYMPDGQYPGPGLLELPGLQQRRFVRGTECHSGETERAIAAWAGAEWDTLTGHRAPDHWRVRYNDVPCSFQHHCSATSRIWLESGELSRMLIQEISECASVGYEPPRLVVRAHRHRYGAFDNGNGMAVVSPAWQPLTRHGAKLVPGAVPKVGMVVLDWRGMEPGELPRVHRFLRAMPLPKEVVR